jgi:glucose dehydrogenase
MSVAPRSPPHGLLRRVTCAAAIAAALAIGACNRESRSKSANIGWPSHNNSYDGQRYAALSQIDTRNVSRLEPVCELKLGEQGPFQTGPLVVGETMFLTAVHTTVVMSRPS